MEKQLKEVDQNFSITKEEFSNKTEGLHNMEGMINQMSEAIVSIKTEGDEKLGRLPLLEKKMNKWIKIFEMSDKDNNNKLTET